MRISCLPGLSLACLLLVACTPSVPALVQEDPPTGIARSDTDYAAEEPDDMLRQLASAGINAGVLMGPMLKQFALVASAYYDERDKHPQKPATYMLFDVGDWTFENGWYMQRTDNGDSVLRAQFLDATGTPPVWDLTLDTNYDPDLHPDFPTNLTQMRLEVDKKLPGDGRMAITMFGPLGADRNTEIDAYGSGSVTLPPPLGQAEFEALNASFKPGQDVDQGQIGIKSLAGAATLQFSGQFVKTGLAGSAKLIKNGHAAGNVTYDAASGKWQIVNSKGNFPL